MLVLIAICNCQVFFLELSHDHLATSSRSSTSFIESDSTISTEQMFTFGRKLILDIDTAF